MKRSADLSRAILLAIEEHPDEYLPREPTITGWHAKTVSAHIRLLTEEGYIEANHWATYIDDGRPAWRALRLLPPGHDFLDKARDATLWNKARAALGSAFGTTALAVIKDLLVDLAKRVP